MGSGHFTPLNVDGCYYRHNIWVRNWTLSFAQSRTNFAKPLLVEIKDSFCMLYAISLVFIYCVKYFDKFIERITLLRLRLPYESTFVLVKHLNWLVSFCITWSRNWFRGLKDSLVLLIISYLINYTHTCF